MTPVVSQGVRGQGSGGLSGVSGQGHQSIAGMLGKKDTVGEFGCSMNLGAGNGMLAGTRVYSVRVPPV